MKERREQGERVLILEHLAGRGGGRAVGRAPLYKNSISTEFSPLWNWLHFYPSRACVYTEGETMAVLARLEFRGGFDRRFKSSCWLLRAPTFEPGQVLHQIARIGKRAVPDGLLAPDVPSGADQGFLVTVIQMIQQQQALMALSLGVWHGLMPPASHSLQPSSMAKEWLHVATYQRPLWSWLGAWSEAG